MNRLSTELDENILWRLVERKDLNAMSQVSKYYRKIAEPFLYKDLVFDEDQYFRITVLFLTIVRRPDLAKYIKRVTLYQEWNARPIELSNDTYYREFFNNITTVRDMVDDIGKDLDWEVITRWFGSIYDGGETCDGALALILCLAPDLEHLDLGCRTNTLLITTKLLEHEWRPRRKSLEIKPFGKLKSLCIGGGACRAAPVFPWMQSLNIKYRYRSHLPGIIYFPYRSPDTNLRILEMKNVDASPADFEKLLSYAEVGNLKELKVSRLYISYDSEWKDYDLRLMTRIIEAHLPGLETLHWFENDWDRDAQFSPRTFGSFKGLSNLSELKVDAHLLATHDLVYNRRAETLALTRPEEYLPDSLKALHVVSLSAEDERIDSILEVARTFNLETVELSLSLEDWDSGWGYRPAGVQELRKSRRKFFRESVASMAALDTTMRVWRQEGRYKKERLFASGYQRPWPIWIDVDSHHWSRHVRDAWEAMKGIQNPRSDDALGYRHYEQGRVDQGDSSEEGDSDVDEDGKITGQGENKKKSDGEKQGDNGVGDMVAEKGSDGDEGRSESGAARK